MKQITFSLPLEALGEATEALLLGDFNNWNPENAPVLTVQADGILKTNILLEPGKTYEYRFLLNDGRWVNDWAALGYVYKPELNAENSVITIEEEILVITETPVLVEKTKAAAKKSPAKTAKPKAEVIIEKPKAEPKTTKKVVKAEAPAKDDLTKIEGIGPKIAKLLEAEGIVTFKDLSKATAKKLKGILDAAGPKFQMHNPTSWPKQAKLAAAGSWEDLKTLQNELTAGK